MNKRFVFYALAAIMLVGCQTERSAEGRLLTSGRKNMTEAERFDVSVRKELPKTRHRRNRKPHADIVLVAIS